MDAHVVYKNFPREVLQMSEASYWIRQICIYLGAPYETIAQELEPRPNLSESVELKVVAPAPDGALEALAHTPISRSVS
ncbi:hypothetical protein ACW9UR_23830 [Halovulum sp. GXIMD14794]